VPAARAELRAARSRRGNEREGASGGHAGDTTGTLAPVEAQHYQPAFLVVIRSGLRLVSVSRNACFAEAASLDAGSAPSRWTVIRLFGSLRGEGPGGPRLRAGLPHPQLMDLRLAVGVKAEVARAGGEQLEGGGANRRDPGSLVDGETVRLGPDLLRSCWIGYLERLGRAPRAGRSLAGRTRRRCCCRPGPRGGSSSS
jgi:hypothetical protein